MRAAHLSLSTLTGSTLALTTHITAPMAIYSTMMGSSITVSTMTGSTLFGSTMLMSSITTSFLTLSTLTVSSINNNAPVTGFFSTLTVSSLVSVSTISTASTIYGSSLITTGNVGIGTTAPVSQLAIHGNNSTSITVTNGFNAGFYTQYGLAHSAGQYSANSLAGDTVIEALGGNLVLESQNKNIYLSMPSTNVSNVISIAGSGTRPTFSTAGWGSLTNTLQYSNIALSWTAPIACTISSISMYLGQGNNGTNISMYINGNFINEWWPFQGYGLYVINATGSSVANGVATTPTPFSALNQLVVQAGQVLTIYVSSLQTYNYFYYGRDSITSGIGFSIVYNAPKVDLSLLNTATTLSMGLSGVGIGTTAPSANLHVHNSSSSFTGAPTVHIGDGQIDAVGTYGMAQLVRANNAADNKAHLSFIKNGLSVFGMGYYPGSNISAFGLVPSFSSMATANGLWILTNGNVGIGLTNPTNRLDTYDGTARTGTHATGRALYATFNGGEYSNGIAEFRHSNGSQGIGIGYAGLYATGYNTDQEFNIIAKGAGLINLRSATRLTGPGDNCMTYYGPNSTWSSYLVVGAGTDKSGGSTAQVISTNGNLHLDAGNTRDIYYGYYPHSRGAPNVHRFYGSDIQLASGVPQNSDYYSQVLVLNGTTLQKSQCMMREIYFHNNVAWGGGVNMTYAFYHYNTISPVQIYGKCSGYYSGSGMMQTTIRLYSHSTGNYYSYPLNSFVNVGGNHFTVPLNVISNGLPTGWFDVYVYSTSGWITDGNDQLTVCVQILPVRDF